MSQVELIDSVGTTKYYVVTSQAKMPNSCWGRYCYSAVIRVDGDYRPTQIRDTQTATVLRRTIPGFDGRTSRCAAERNRARMIDRALWLAGLERSRRADSADAGYIESLAERSGEDL